MGLQPRSNDKLPGVMIVGALLVNGILAMPGGAMSAADYRLQGLSYRQQGQWAAAIESLQKSVELEPDNLSGRVILGWTLHLAVQQAEKAVTGERETNTRHEIMTRQEAIQILRENLQRDAYHVPTLNALGIVYLVHDRLWASIITHSRAGLIQPENEVAFYNLSLAFQRLGNHGLAIAAAEKAIVLEPYNPHPFVALAIVYWVQGNRSSAQDIYLQATNLDSRYWDVNFLAYLDEAGFSLEQIAQSQAILLSL